MNSKRTILQSLIARLWRSDKPLTAVGLLMLAALAAFLVGLLVDPRTIAGAPPWLKPAKFAVSSAIYALTLAVVFTMLPSWRRTRLLVGWTTAVVFVIEVAIVAVQAWRGTTSHFNVSTPVDAILFAVMGLAILLQTLSSVFVATSLFREPLAQRAMGTALRAGMVITIVGASSAGLMTTPTRAQVVESRETGHLRTSGAHTVGAPDGGKGLPGTGWSREHGDLRVPHFVGLHALQVLPIVALIARRRRSDDGAVRVVRVATVSYIALFATLLIEALRGESLLAPGPMTFALIVAWGVGTAAGLWSVSRRRGSAMPGFSAYVGA